VSGAMTASPLAMREAARAIGLPVVTAGEMSEAAWLPTRQGTIRLYQDQTQPTIEDIADNGEVASVVPIVTADVLHTQSSSVAASA